MTEEKRNGYAEVEAALTRRAVELWGEERAAEIEGRSRTRRGRSGW